MIVVLDSGPLGIITSPNRVARETQAMLVWEQKMLLAGHFLLVPAIADYELRREHLRRGADRSIAELDRFVNAVEGRYLELTDSALKIAAQFWMRAIKVFWHNFHLSFGDTPFQPNQATIATKHPNWVAAPGRRDSRSAARI